MCAPGVDFRHDVQVLSARQQSGDGTAFADFYRKHGNTIAMIVRQALQAESLESPLEKLIATRLAIQIGKSGFRTTFAESWVHNLTRDMCRWILSNSTAVEDELAYDQTDQFGYDPTVVLKNNPLPRAQS